MAGKPKRYEVLLTQGAEQDLESIDDYIAEFDCVANANYVLDRLMEAVEALVKYPEKSSYPKELVALPEPDHHAAMDSTSMRLRRSEGETCNDLRASSRPERA